MRSMSLVFQAFALIMFLLTLAANGDKVVGMTSAIFWMLLAILHQLREKEARDE